VPGGYRGSISRDYLRASADSHERRGHVVAGQQAFALVRGSSQIATSGSSSPPSDTLRDTEEPASTSFGIQDRGGSEDVWAIARSIQDVSWARVRQPAGATNT
jgi:hypothetical protein